VVTLPLHVRSSVSIYCKNISDRVPEDGAPVAKPVFLNNNNYIFFVVARGGAVG
jgi:hypothetical protein